MIEDISLLGYSTGNPGVFQGYPNLYLPNTCTYAQGRGIYGYG
jgi:hypothetical protein